MGIDITLGLGLQQPCDDQPGGVPSCSADQLIPQAYGGLEVQSI